MSSRLWSLTLSLPLALLLLIGIYGAQALGTREARGKIATLMGLASLPPDKVKVKSINVGPGAHAIVEAQVETAFKFTKTGDQWEVTEIRLGDNQWESLELIKTALTKEKTLRTQAELSALQTAIEAYRREHKRLVPAQNIVELTDELAPIYVARVIRYDAWDRELRYQPLGSGYRLSSAGPDGRAGTADDIAVEFR